MSITSTTAWNPWRHAGRRYPRIGITCREPLPRHLRAAITSAGIFLRPGLTQTQRRCALTHEIIHLERGPVPRDPELAAREERIVEDLTARRLIPLSMLIEALTWAADDDRHALADELWVDDITLTNRLRNLTATERARIDDALRVRRPWTMDV